MANRRYRVSCLGCGFMMPDCVCRDRSAATKRRSQPITRGEILDAIAATRRACGGNVGDHHDAVTNMLDQLKEAFE